ncbi:ABC transporter ATP-binding protein [Jannaschia pagri]|uniref:ABC transporter ATP-binding protein n=1 Tax=Jannaschia pagri TaxID=2829797 RepID=A0ABQ4NKR8_9RHOB|nr:MULTISPECIES: dipeptide ABC transporter ATP-binding protein [unclassified Jannaschia]GIT90860.1 ABC transporter ATP-binding protein [Jannaschia sp. AI_61]GIT94692.1 ABC transporter ATP-binding protein [Jannaschia sp. AI_62]
MSQTDPIGNDGPPRQLAAPPLITVRKLSLAIHGAPILNEIDLAIQPGAVTALVGESGSGKSMTALALMGLLPGGSTTTGQALFDGSDLLTLSERAWLGLRGDDIAMIFQEPMTALNPVHTIGAQVAEPLRLCGIRRAEAARIARDRLDRVGLSHVPLDRYPHELSGGQRQRVCIAMAIARRPRLLIADEPTTALDVTTQAEILSLLRSLVDDEGMALLLITHDLGVVAGMADHVAVMERGCIVESDRTEALFRGHRHPYTAALLAASRPPPHTPRPPDGTAILEARDLRRTYGAVTAVDGVSFTLHRGESLGLVGESGCGKSTLTRALLGLEPLQGGSVTFDGTPGGQSMTRRQRARISVVFQDPYGSFNPRWTVRRIVQEPFHLTGKPRDADAQAARALTEVGLTTADLEKYPHEFSGGQRQRIAIARALITKPQVLVLDEAVSALDVRVRAQVLALLSELQDRLGLSYLFISHDLTVVRAICDRVLVMQGGRIVEQGAIDKVFEAPAAAYTRRLIDAAPRIPAEWLAARNTPAATG